MLRDPQNEDKRLFVQVKNNLAPELAGLSYEITSEGLAWSEKPCDMTAEEAFSAGSSPKDQKRAVSEAIEFLRQTLDQIGLPAKQVQAEAKALGISSRTLNRAKDECGVISKRRDGVWYWMAPRPA